MSLLLVDEWIIHYLCPDSDKQQIGLDFLSQLNLQGHVMVVRNNSPFTKKLSRFCKSWIASEHLRNLSRDRYDPAKVRLVENIVDVPPAILVRIPDDDRYLAETLASVPDSILVTTDETLHERAIEVGFRSVFFRDDVAAALADIATFL